MTRKLGDKKMTEETEPVRMWDPVKCIIKCRHPAGCYLSKKNFKRMFRRTRLCEMLQEDFSSRWGVPMMEIFSAPPFQHQSFLSKLFYMHLMFSHIQTFPLLLSLHFSPTGSKLQSSKWLQVVVHQMADSLPRHADFKLQQGLLLPKLFLDGIQKKHHTEERECTQHSNKRWCWIMINHWV